MNTDLLKRITNDAEFAAAMDRFSELFEPDPSAPEYQEYYLLGLLIHDYDQKQFDRRPLPPLDVLKFEMEQRGLRAKDLVGIIGGSGRVSEVLKGRRELTLQMIRQIKEHLGISSDLLIGSSSPKARPREVKTLPRLAVNEARSSYREPKSKMPTGDKEG